MIVITVQGKSTMYQEESSRRWLVVLAAFCVQFIICGIMYALGIFHTVFQDAYGTSHFDTAWAGSIQLYVTCLSSVVFRGFMAKFGCRVSVMTGGALAAAGLALSIYVENMYQLYLTYGLITGIGFGLACTPSIMIVEQHFHRSRFQALSVVVGGVGAGIIVFPFLIRYLLEVYAWKGTLLFLAGIVFNITACGAMMYPVPKQKEVRLLPMLSCLPCRMPIFLGMCAANFFWSFGSTVVYMYLPSYSVERGTEFAETMLLISCIGMASFTARSIFAFMGHNSALDDVTAVLCSVALGVVLTGVSPLMFEKFAGQIGFALLYGFYTGYWTTFLSQVSRELVGPEYIALGNGYLCFMIALGALLGGPCAGLLIREEEEFKYAFYLAGACLLFSNIILLIFKFKSCGPLPSMENSCRQGQKTPLIDDADQAEACIAKTFEGEQVLVEAVITSV